jgi:DNA topoisomerase VI subunit B
MSRTAPGEKPTFNRTTFCTSREMDFFSERELVTQTGHGREEWPLVMIKELVDNAVDACEESGVAPVIGIKVDGCGITVADNGPGIPEATISAIQNFTLRVSNREAYVSPCRGSQGNALKTLLPMPYVLNQEQGKFIVSACGKQHVITCRIDPISQRPQIRDECPDQKSKKLRNGMGEIKLALSATEEGQDRKSKKRQKGAGEIKQAFSGTEIRLEWGELIEKDADGNGTLWPFSLHGCDSDWDARIYALVEGFAVFNPHTTIMLDLHGKSHCWKATNPRWLKWKPNQPTSPHWYEQRHLERLIGAYITHQRDTGTDRLVSDFVAEFDGLSGSAKRTKVLTAADLKRARLFDFVQGDRLDSAKIGRLLEAMRQHTKPVKPARLGLIGEPHLKECLIRMGVVSASFRYSKQMCKDATKLPWVVECAFGWLGQDAEDQRKIVTGVNWSAAIREPFRSFGSTGEGLQTQLARMRVTWNEPVVFVLHLAHPRAEFTDRGKSALYMGGQDQ